MKNKNWFFMVGGVVSLLGISAILSAAPMPRILVLPSVVAYPAAAKQKGITGTVELGVTMGARGEAASIRVLGGPAELRNAAITAVRKTRLEGFEFGRYVLANVEFKLGSEPSVDVPSK